MSEPTPRGRFGAAVEKLRERIPPELIPLDIPPEQIERALSRVMSAVTALATKSPNLQRCGEVSLAQAIVICATLDLVPTLDRYTPIDIIPRRDKSGQWHANIQISARGLVVLAQREGWSLSTGIIRSGEDYEYEEGATPRLLHKPALDPEPLSKADLSPLEAAYVTARRPGMVTAFRLIGRRAILKRKAIAQTHKIWNVWPEEMVRKTAIHYGMARHMIAVGDRMALALRIIDEEAAGHAEASLGESERPADPLAVEAARIEQHDVPTPDAEAELRRRSERVEVEAELVVEGRTEPPIDEAPADRFDDEENWARSIERESAEMQRGHA